MASINIRKWQGSLATSVAPEDTIPGDFITLDNFIYDADGLPVVRGGRRAISAGTYSSPAEPIKDIHVYRSGWMEDERVNFLVFRSGRTLIATSDPSDLGESKVLKTNISDYSGRPRASFANFRGMVCLTLGDPSDPRIYYWNHEMSTVKQFTESPPATIIAAHANRLWAVSMDNPSQLFYSALYDPWKWGTLHGGGWIHIGPGDGNIISALIPDYAGEMIVFKDGPNGGATYRLQGLGEPFVLSPLSQTLGAMHNRVANQIGDGDVFFGSRRGMHSLRRVFKHGDLEATFIDNDISEQWRRMPNNVKMVASAGDDYHHDTWWLFVDTDFDGINDEGWLFNYRRMNPRGNPSISKVTFGAGSAVTWEDPRNNRDVFVTGGTDARLYSEHNPEAQDSYRVGVNYYKTDYDWKAVLAPIDGGEPFKVKAWNRLWLTLDNWGEGDFTVEWWGDNRHPSSETMSLNPIDHPTPFYGQPDNAIGAPDMFNVSTAVTMQEGGKALNLSFSGTRGRLKLRGARLDLSVGREHMAADKFLAYTRPRTP